MPVHASRKAVLPFVPRHEDLPLLVLRCILILNDDAGDHGERRRPSVSELNESHRKLRDEGYGLRAASSMKQRQGGEIGSSGPMTMDTAGSDVHHQA